MDTLLSHEAIKAIREDLWMAVKQVTW